MRSESAEDKKITGSFFGRNIKVEIFGGSHEDHIGTSIRGLPQGTRIDMEELCRFLARRAPGSSPFTTARQEKDLPILQSGAEQERNIAFTSGGPLVFIIKNTDIRSADYKKTSDVPRPGHADYTARVKYRGTLNMAGGGPFSGRMTAPLCIAGGIAMQMLSRKGIEIAAHIASVEEQYDTLFDPVSVNAAELHDLRERLSVPGTFPVISEKAGILMQQIIKAAKDEGDSVGGIVEVCAAGVPPGLGGPMYDSAESVIAPIVFGIPAVKGIEFGTGFASSILKGSENNDPFCIENGSVKTVTNHHGGILGGITSGMPLTMRAAFKPTPSIEKEQDSIDMEKMIPEKIIISGRHDPCVAVRAVPVMEAALAAGLLDLMEDEK